MVEQKNPYGHHSTLKLFTQITTLMNVTDELQIPKAERLHSLERLFCDLILKGCVGEWGRVYRGEDRGVNIFIRDFSSAEKVAYYSIVHQNETFVVEP